MAQKRDATAALNPQNVSPVQETKKTKGMQWMDAHAFGGQSSHSGRPPAVLACKPRCYDDRVRSRCDRQSLAGSPPDKHRCCFVQFAPQRATEKIPRALLFSTHRHQHAGGEFECNRTVDSRPPSGNLLCNSTTHTSPSRSSADDVDSGVNRRE